MRGESSEEFVGPVHQDVLVPLVDAEHVLDESLEDGSITAVLIQRAHLFIRRLARASETKMAVWRRSA